MGKDTARSVAPALALSKLHSFRYPLVAADYLGPDLAAFSRAEEPAFEDALIAEVAATASRSCHHAEHAEYVGTLRRFVDAAMVEFSS